MSTTPHIRAASAEWAKLRSLRAPRMLGGTAVVLAALSSAVFILSFPVTQRTALDRAPLTDVLTASVLGVDVAAIVLVVFAAWFVGIEFRTGAITEALLRLPRRSAVITAKALVIAAVTVLTAVVAAVALTVVAVALAAALTGTSWSAALTAAVSPEHLRLLFGSALMPVVFALLAAFAAFAFGSMAAGVLGALGLIVASMLAGWLPAGAAAVVAPVLPLAAVHTISGAAEAGSTEFLGIVPAVIVLAAWVAIGWILAAWRLRRRDF
ncbi:hypothetical protein [Brevibacterium sp. XM4083]|uniref:hypothetical protein n=1 Tax=Brevibacterium sp. XM4083 TaxID=2583238 RepID=UPI00112941B2|nr:hypothetical protein [Brevibacterium sp. XM4083]MCM1012964.1 hypothetical protein [Brevibacterium sp. XM4083]